MPIPNKGHLFITATFSTILSFSLLAIFSIAIASNILDSGTDSGIDTGLDTGDQGEFFVKIAPVPTDTFPSLSGGIITSLAKVCDVQNKGNPIADLSNILTTIPGTSADPAWLSRITTTPWGLPLSRYRIVSLNFGSLATLIDSNTGGIQFPLFSNVTINMVTESIRWNGEFDSFHWSGFVTGSFESEFNLHQFQKSTRLVIRDPENDKTYLIISLEPPTSTTSGVFAIMELNGLY